MIKNYFRTALRNLRRNKLFSLINVLGLSVGISAALVIYLIVDFDFSFENFQQDGGRIYRVVTESRFSGETFPNSGVPYPLPDAARQGLTGIEESARFFTGNSFKTAIPSAKDGHPVVFKHQENIILADEHYFRLFPLYQWLAGSPNSCLREPFRTVITGSRASKYYPGLTPSQIIGRPIVYNDSITCTIEGIVKDLPENTDFTCKEFISLATIPGSSLRSMIEPDWGSVSSSTQFFVRLAPHTSPAQIERQFVTLRQRLAKEKNDTANRTSHLLQPLSDLHFNATYANFSGRLAHRPTLYGLLLVAVFLLALGCINFVNLTTAQSAQRAKEIGIRKTLGSSRRQLIAQFLSEAFLLTLFSALLSLALTPWLLKIFADFIPTGLHLDLLHKPSLILFLLGLVISVSLLAGFYPALVLSRFRPVAVLKNQAYTGTATTRKALLRKTLTISQFVIAQIFIMATLIVGRQIQYTMDMDMGVKKDAIVIFNTPYGILHAKEKRALLMDHLQTIPGISLISSGGEPPASGNTWSQALTYKDGKKEINTDVHMKFGDSNYTRIYGIRLLAGRDLMAGDSVKELVINQTYARILGFKTPEEAMGKSLVADDIHIPIVGVMADFHQASLRTPIKPVALNSTNHDYYCYHIALQQLNSGGGKNTSSAAWKATIARIEKAYRAIYPEEDFDYRFFDDSIAKFYTGEQKISRLLRWATGLTIFISCLGLLGLVVYATQLRKKEIGVRKVLGASVAQIVSILSQDFVKLVCIAFIIAVPIAWWTAHRWLENFAYRATISWWIYGLSGLAMLGIALLTLSIQTVRAANANPVNSLRTE